jgi:hypothetical protein
LGLVFLRLSLSVFLRPWILAWKPRLENPHFWQNRKWGTRTFLRGFAAGRTNASAPTFTSLKL